MELPGQSLQDCQPSVSVDKKVASVRDSTAVSMRGQEAARTVDEASVDATLSCVIVASCSDHF